MLPDLSDSNQPSEGPVQVLLELGHTGDQTFNVRVSPHAAAEMRALMEAEGVYSGGVLEHSAGSELAILAGSFVGGLGGLAAVLKAYVHRNQHKSITFSHGEESVLLQGYGEEEAKRLIDEALDGLHRRQQQRDENGGVR